MGRLILPAHYRKTRFNRKMKCDMDVELSEESARHYAYYIMKKARMFALEWCGLEGRPKETEFLVADGPDKNTKKIRCIVTMEDGRWNEGHFKAIGDEAESVVRRLCRAN